ncbi:MAG: hypothetical protein M1823_005202 [Watsoniomyces obsoletus]|nr:MAG: hypothetical protein M1823_005202 [Watsoniomyces obsoletus]
MSPPRRRSARLANLGVKSAKSTARLTSDLLDMLERDHPEQDITPNRNSIMSPPMAAMTPAHGQHQHMLTTDKEIIKTPHTATRAYPSHDEMHPSKVRQSTTKQPDVGLLMGFVDITTPHTANRPSKTTIGVAEGTPTKVRTSHQKGSSEFEFKFARRTPLGPEAQKMMEDLREEASKIKENMVVEQGVDGNGESQQGMISGRKIARAVGKSGRFSDVHRAEFKKMDSIAAHPSAFRAQMASSSSAQPLPKTPGIKRTKSQARLDEVVQEVTTSQDVMAESSNANTSKRVKMSAQDDTSSKHPVSHERPTGISMARISAMMGTPDGRRHPRAPRGLPAAVSTPTKASLARSASVKNVRATPAKSTIARSKSARNLFTPGARSEAPHKNHAHHHGQSSVGPVKSILRQPQVFKTHDEDVQEEQHLPAMLPSYPLGGIDRELSPSPYMSNYMEYHKSPGKRVQFNMSEASFDSPSPPGRGSSELAGPKSPEVSPSVTASARYNRIINARVPTSPTLTTPSVTASEKLNRVIERPMPTSPTYSSPSVKASAKLNRINNTPMGVIDEEHVTMSSSPVMTSMADAVKLSQQSPSRSTMTSPVMVRYPSLPVPGSATTGGGNMAGYGHGHGQMSRAHQDFTFSAGKAIKFGDISGVNNTGSGVTGASDDHTVRPTSEGSMGSMTGGRTIRQVRPSIVHESNKNDNKKNAMGSLNSSAIRLGGGNQFLDQKPLHLARSPIKSGLQFPAIPHGMSNKKRARSDLDDEEEGDDHYMSRRRQQSNSPSKATQESTKEVKTEDKDNSSDQENRDPKRLKRHHDHHTMTSTEDNAEEKVKEKATGSMFKSSPSKFRIMTTGAGSGIGGVGAGRVKAHSTSPYKKKIGMGKLMFSKSPVKKTVGGSNLFGKSTSRANATIGTGMGIGTGKGMGIGMGMNVNVNPIKTESRIPSPVKNNSFSSSTITTGMGNGMGIKEESSTGGSGGSGKDNKKNGKKPVGMLSMSRLNALARPKTRG